MTFVSYRGGVLLIQKHNNKLFLYRTIVMDFPETWAPRKKYPRSELHICGLVAFWQGARVCTDRKYSSQRAISVKGIKCPTAASRYYSMPFDMFKLIEHLWYPSYRKQMGILDNAM